MSSIEAAALLYQDEHLVMVNKPAGMPVQPDPTGDPSLLEHMVAMSGLGEVGLVHRLDRPVSGVVVMALGADALRLMNEEFRQRRVKKVYWAIVEGHPQGADGSGVRTIEHQLVHDAHKHRARIVQEGGKNVHLGFRVLAKGDRYTLVEVVPREGTFHQIRAQLAAIGHPIKGDVKYGARRGDKDRSIALHARSLSFAHPITGAPVQVLAPAPPEGVWKALVPGDAA